jgi:hypothetical protein
MKNEKLQPTNNNVSKFTNNKRHACIAQNYKLQVTKLQVTRYKKTNHKSQIPNSQIYKFTNYNITIKILN